MGICILRKKEKLEWKVYITERQEPESHLALTDWRGTGREREGEFLCFLQQALHHGPGAGASISAFATSTHKAVTCCSRNLKGIY